MCVCRSCFLFSIHTIIVGEGHDGGQVTLGVLGNDTEAGHGASLAGDVQSCVPTVVSQLWVAAGLQELLHQLRLLCDHC